MAPKNYLQNFSNPRLVEFISGVYPNCQSTTISGNTPTNFSYDPNTFQGRMMISITGLNSRKTVNPKNLPTELTEFQWKETLKLLFNMG